MLFNSAPYALFLVAVFLVHWLSPKIVRRPFLLLASYYFYASAVPQYVWLILGQTIFNYLMGVWIDATTGKRHRLVLLWVAIIGNLGSLAYFKYTGFLLATLQAPLSHIPGLLPIINEPFFQNIILPLGISFFTFEYIHYVAEVYKGLKAMRNPIDFGLFAAFFPTQIAGPIKRFPDFAKQLANPLSFREVQFDDGLWLLLRGLLKKTLVADRLVPLVATAFAQPGQLGAGAAWFSVIAFATQIYCDFSGYTDMGRGSAILLGYTVPENFLSPYQSPDPSEFWHRWHVSLSSWLRDYLYIPLGGSRVAKWRLYLNLMITMALGGLWHGASWHFVVWGIYQGALLSAHRLWSRTIGKIPAYQRYAAIPLIDFMKRPVTFLYVCFGWIFFRASSLTSALVMMQSMFSFGRKFTAGLDIRANPYPLVVVGGAAVVVVAGWLWSIARDPVLRWWQAGPGTTFSPGRVLALQTYLFRPTLLLAGCVLYLLLPPTEVKTFIYFQF